MSPGIPRMTECLGDLSFWCVIPSGDRPEVWSSLLNGLGDILFSELKTCTKSSVRRSVGLLLQINRHLLNFACEFEGQLIRGING